MKVSPFGLERQAICDALDELRHPFRVVIDRAKNPFNIGSIIRTAHSFMAQEILLVGDEPWYERAAMGMQRYEHIREFTSRADFIKEAQDEAWPLIAFEREPSSHSLWHAPIPRDAVLVFGNEDEGVAPEILACAQSVVAIPMYGINHSYPIAVAAGIAMAEWARRHAATIAHERFAPGS